ncbi:flowering time control protein FCA-like [Salvia divinorum]|uniref:Flowering time control protein FCA-like n=1 Tax=Salvia divinorum TaxID=28513 RepID=A0ABD1GES6_SALDI
MEKNGGERRADHCTPAPPFQADGGYYHYEERQEQFHGSHQHQHQHQSDHRHHQNFNGLLNESTGFHLNGDSKHSLPLSGQKRPIPHSNCVDYNGFVKLYVVGIPKTATELDVSAVFGEFGDIIEVVLLKDKRTGLQQECCFVKYARIDQAEHAIGAFNCHYTFPGALIPLKVKYAERERERLGNFGAQFHKLYVGCLNRLAARRDIEEIFSPYGVIQEIFIVRDEFKKNRGCGFVEYISRDMALAAIHALNGIYVMRGCDQPLIVRFADPKKPRIGDSRPTLYSNDPASVHMLPIEMQQMKYSHSGCKIETIASNDSAPVSSAFDSSGEAENFIECDWSEHVSPDGDLYYYNCVTCESRWEKPEEYAIYEEGLNDLEEQ